MKLLVNFFTYLLMLPANGTTFPVNETDRKWDDTHGMTQMPCYVIFMVVIEWLQTLF